MNKLRKDFESAIDKNSAESGSDTPDFVLAQYLTDCLKALDQAVTDREKWYGRKTNSSPEVLLASKHKWSDQPLTVGRLEELIAEAKANGCTEDSLVIGMFDGPRPVSAAVSYTCVYQPISEYRGNIYDIQCPYEQVEKQFDMPEMSEDQWAKIVSLPKILLLDSTVGLYRSTMIGPTDGK